VVATRSAIRSLSHPFVQASARPGALVVVLATCGGAPPG
jgi:hypothetical protein